MGGYYPPVKGRLLLQGVPSPKTIHWIVFGFTPCEAPSYFGALPRTLPEALPLDSAKGSILPLESHSLCSVSDVRSTIFMIVSEFASGNVEAVELAQLALQKKQHRGIAVLLSEYEQ